jgi:hypothetical protein
MRAGVERSGRACEAEFRQLQHRLRVGETLLLPATRATPPDRDLDPPLLDE